MKGTVVTFLCRAPAPTCCNGSVKCQPVRAGPQRSAHVDLRVSAGVGRPAVNVTGPCQPGRGPTDTRRRQRPRHRACPAGALRAAHSQHEAARPADGEPGADDAAVASCHVDRIGAADRLYLVGRHRDRVAGQTGLRAQGIRCNPASTGRCPGPGRWYSKGGRDVRQRPRVRGPHGCHRNRGTVYPTGSRRLSDRSASAVGGDRRAGDVAGAGGGKEGD